MLTEEEKKRNSEYFGDIVSQGTQHVGGILGAMYASDLRDKHLRKKGQDVLANTPGSVVDKVLAAEKVPRPIKQINKVPVLGGLAKAGGRYLPWTAAALATNDAISGAMDADKIFNKENPNTGEYAQAAIGGLVNGFSMGTIPTEMVANALHEYASKPYESEIMKKIANSDAVGLALRALGY